MKVPRISCQDSLDTLVMPIISFVCVVILYSFQKEDEVPVLRWFVGFGWYISSVD